VAKDVLEQIVDDYLQMLGHFTKQNVPYGPPPVQGTRSQSQSDLDVIGYKPQAPPNEPKVFVVSCKSWQKGFNTQDELTALVTDGKSHGSEARWVFRELWSPDWSQALHQRIADLTGESTFAYRIAVTQLRGTATPVQWAEQPVIKENLAGCSFGFLRLQEMWRSVLAGTGTHPAGSETGRLAQLLKAAGLADTDGVG
jgi:hypothetical protein